MRWLLIIFYPLLGTACLNKSEVSRSSPQAAEASSVGRTAKSFHFTLAPTSDALGLAQNTDGGSRLASSFAIARVRIATACTSSTSDLLDITPGSDPTCFLKPGEFTCDKPTCPNGQITQIRLEAPLANLEKEIVQIQFDPLSKEVMISQKYADKSVVAGEPSNFTISLTRRAPLVTAGATTRSTSNFPPKSSGSIPSDALNALTQPSPTSSSTESTVKLHEPISIQPAEDTLAPCALCSVCLPPSQIPTPSTSQPTASEDSESVDSEPATAIEPPVGVDRASGQINHLPAVEGSTASGKETESSMARRILVPTSTVSAESELVPSATTTPTTSPTDAKEEAQ